VPAWVRRMAQAGAVGAIRAWDDFDTDNVMTY